MNEGSVVQKKERNKRQPYQKISKTFFIFTWHNSLCKKFNKITKKVSKAHFSKFSEYTISAHNWLHSVD